MRQKNVLLIALLLLAGSLNIVNAQAQIATERHLTIEEATKFEGYGPPPAGNLKVKTEYAAHEVFKGDKNIRTAPGIGVSIRFWDLWNCGYQVTDRNGETTFRKLVPSVYRVDLASSGKHYITQFPTVHNGRTTSIYMRMY